MHINIIWPKNVWYVHTIGILTTIPNITSPQSPSNQLIHHMYLININIITIRIHTSAWVWGAKEFSFSTFWSSPKLPARRFWGTREDQRVNFFEVSPYLPQCFRNAMECRKTWHTSAKITVMYGDSSILTHARQHSEFSNNLFFTSIISRVFVLSGQLAGHLLIVSDTFKMQLLTTAKGPRAE